jgi:hypothetical protein
MDTSKWKSVLVPRDTYDEIVAVAFIEGRTISGQLRMMFDYWKRQHLTKNDLKVLSDVIEKNKWEQEKALLEDKKAEVEEALKT